MRFLTAFLTLSAALAAQTFTPQMPATVPEIHGTVTEPFVMRYIDVKIGDGAPATAGKQYKVHYTGWLRDGTKFDFSRDRNEPLTFVQGQRQVIARMGNRIRRNARGRTAPPVSPVSIGLRRKGPGPRD